MRRPQWNRLIDRTDDKVVVVAFIFLFFSMISALASAAISNVEGLEFSQVQLMGSNELEITQGDTNSLKIRGKEDDLDPAPFVVDGDTLRLGITSDGKGVRNMKFKLTVKDLKELLLQGSGEVFVKPLVVGDLLVSVEGSGVVRMFDLEAAALELRVIGSGTLQAVNVVAQTARLNMKGSGDLQLGSLVAGSVKAHLAGSGDVLVENEGRTDKIEVGVMGSGDIDMAKLSAQQAKVTIMGSGDVELSVVQSLDAEILGSGDLLYHGDPKVSRSIMGSGDVTRQD